MQYKKISDELREIVFALESNPAKFVETVAPELIKEAEGETDSSPMMLKHMIGARNVPEAAQALYTMATVEDLLLDNQDVI